MLDKNEALVCKLKGNLIGWNFKFLKGPKSDSLPKNGQALERKCLQVQTIHSRNKR